MLWNKNNAARIGVICKSASSAPHFLLARLQGRSFQFVFQLVSLPYTLQIPSISVLLTAFKTFCWNKLGILTGNKLAFLQHIKWNPLGIQGGGRETHFREDKVSFGYPGTSLESNSRLALVQVFFFKGHTI